MTWIQAQQRAEKSFKQEERARDGRNAMMEYDFASACHSRKDRTLEIAPIS